MAATTDLNPGDLNFILSSLVLDKLAQLGGKHFILCPGFRNSALILAARENKKIRAISVVDERSAAFLALGIAKATGELAVVCSTSGTAVANFFPAILEAEYSHTPLLILSADRPRTLVGLGSNQTMNQFELFGNHVKSFTPIDISALSCTSIARMIYDIQKTVSMGTSHNKGPMHINMSFAEPMLPTDLTKAKKKLNSLLVEIPSIEVAASDLTATIVQKEKIFSLLQSKKNIVCILGAHPKVHNSATFFSRLIHFCNHFSIPLLAEPSSGICFGAWIKEAKTLITNTGLLSTTMLPVEAILRFGSVPINKKLNQFLDANPRIPQIIFDVPGEMRNPSLGNTLFIDIPVDDCFTILHESITGNSEKILPHLLTEEKNIQEKLTSKFKSLRAISEPFVWMKLLETIPENSNLFIGNSMPIRDFNTVASPSTKQIHIFHNRGLSGIDGLCASATGIALASQRKTFLVLGDLSAIHDMGSFATVANLINELHLTIIILNNSGGDIFRGLATKQYNESWFTTPQKIDFSSMAQAFSIPFHRIHSIENLENSFSSLIDNPNTGIIEILIDLDDNKKSRE